MHIRQTTPAHILLYVDDWMSTPCAASLSTSRHSVAHFPRSMWSFLAHTSWFKRLPIYCYPLLYSPLLSCSAQLGGGCSITRCYPSVGQANHLATRDQRSLYKSNISDSPEIKRVSVCIVTNVCIRTSTVSRISSVVYFHQQRWLHYILDTTGAAGHEYPKQLSQNSILYRM